MSDLDPNVNRWLRAPGVETTVTPAKLIALINVARAAKNFINHGREWIGGTKYCPECMAEGWHYEGCQSGQAIFDSRKALAEAVEAMDEVSDAP